MLTADIVNVNDNNIIKTALIEACKYLRELVGINPMIIPYIEQDIKDADLDGISWLMFFLHKAEEDINLKKE